MVDQSHVDSPTSVSHEVYFSLRHDHAGRQCGEIEHVGQWRALREKSTGQIFRLRDHECAIGATADNKLGNALASARETFLDMCYFVFDDFGLAVILEPLRHVTRLQLFQARLKHFDSGSQLRIGANHQYVAPPHPGAWLCHYLVNETVSARPYMPLLGDPNYPFGASP